MTTATSDMSRFLTVYRAFRSFGRMRRESFGAAWGNVCAARRRVADGPSTRVQDDTSNGDSL